MLKTTYFPFKSIIILDIRLNLIIDGNFILNKNVFVLHKNNALYGSLHKSLEISIASYRKMFPFANIYIVSDSREKSWRKNILPEYKAKRKKDSDIDWKFVFNAYDEFKEQIKSRTIKVLEGSTIEGDDWISFLINKSNLNGESSLTISSDNDIKQLIKYNISPLYINIMSNEVYNKPKIFLPKNYQLFLNSVNSLDNNDLFNLNDNNDFIKLIDSLILKYTVEEVSPVESLIVKLIAGDNSDNIPSSWSMIKNGKRRGIAETGAKSIYNSYISEFGEPNLKDIDLTENIADLICEKKKISKTNISDIKQNLEKNIKLIKLELDNIPIEIVDKMEKIYDKI